MNDGGNAEVLLAFEHKEKMQFTYLTPKDVAAVLSVSISTLQSWRSHHKGPRYIKPNGRLVRYRVEDIEKWLEDEESRLHQKTETVGLAKKSLVRVRLKKKVNRRIRLKRGKGE